MPVTFAPRAAIASARIPPPHPTSRTDLPARPPASFSTCARRSGLISCSGRNSLVGSHQRCASALNFASSAGSTFAVTTLSPTLSQGRGSERGTRFREMGPSCNASLPPSRLVLEVLFVQVHEAAAGDACATPHPYVRHMLPPVGVDEMRDRVKAREGLERGKVHRREGGRLARSDRADLALQAQ